MITWRDVKSPYAGGAEILTHNILKRLTHLYEIKVLSSAFPKCEFEEVIDGITYTRLGNKRSYIAEAYNWKIYQEVFNYYQKHILDKVQYDVVIEQINTVPFFYALYGDKNTILFIHQLCRKTWFHQMPWFLAWIGYFIFEPLSLLLLRNKQVITVSESSKNDLLRFGFKNENIHIISEGITLTPAESLVNVRKYHQFTVLSFGSIRQLKRTKDQIEAFTRAKRFIPELQLKIAGSAQGEYGKEVLKMVESHPHKRDIQYLGVVSEAQKEELMRKSHVLLSTSEKEGWGMTITEAGSQGTPAIVYDVDGLRDSVKDGKTGIICKKNTPLEMAREIYRVYQNRDLYFDLRYNAWYMSKLVTFDAAAIDFNRAIVNSFTRRSSHGFLRMRRVGYAR